MSVERHFLGWSTPALPAAARFLLERFSSNGVCDLSSMIITVPSARAARRFLELLAWTAEQNGGDNSPISLLPPRIVTLKQLPQWLLREEQHSKIAGETETLLVWMKALQRMDRRELKQIYATLPPEEQVLGWWSLAQELHSLHKELASAEVDYKAIESYCRERSLNSAARWSVLQKISAAMQQQLRAAGRFSEIDVQRLALEDAEFRRPSSALVVLLATVDLNPLHQQLLKKGDFRTLALVHAPEEMAAGFGDYGQLEPEFWAEKPIELDEEWIRVTDRAVEQVDSVLGYLKELQEDVPDDAITVGLGDESLAPVVERAIGFAGRKARHIGAVYLVQSSPLQLLKQLVEFTSEHRPESFLELLRHPAVGDWFQNRCKYSGSERCLLTICNRYFAERLPSKITEHSYRLPPELKQVLAAIDSLMPEGRSSEKRAFGEWMTEISHVLEEVYGDQMYSLDVSEQAGNYNVFEALGMLFEELSDLNQENDFSPRVNFAQAVRLLLNFAKETPLPEPGGEATVELVRWLEVHLDDAPILALVGFNESYIPDNVISAPFLTDSLRREFGLLDNRRRYARDAYQLTAIRNSRKKLLLVCSRQSLQAEPLQPSRLLFACDADTAVVRARKFYTVEENSKAVSALSFAHGEKNHLAMIPRPVPLVAPLGALSVTKFRSYLACPYRFYLAQICGIQTSETLPSEMEANVFGHLFHAVLRDYGREVIEQFNGRQLHTEEQISERLCALLEATARRSFGTQLLASVEIQLHQLERRLKAFARVQKKEFEEGWQIWRVEQQLEKNIEVDGETFLVHGKVDRIDVHPETGSYRILDYKTGDKKSTPEESHHGKGNKDLRWIDLQLPLYRRLSRYIELEPAKVSVGYFCLPSSLNEIGLVMARWKESDFQAADEVAEDVIRALRAQKFWPPSEDLPSFEDGLDAICQDAHLERNTIIAQKEAPMVYWPSFSDQNGRVS